MLIFSAILYLLASVGVIAMGIKYLHAIPPMDYHAEITKEDDLSDATLSILGALYKAMGGSFIALGVTMIALIVFGVLNDLFWAKLTILIGTVLAGGPSAIVTHKVEQAYGVKTPWRIVVALTVLVILAFLISLFQQFRRLKTP